MDMAEMDEFFRQQDELWGMPDETLEEYVLRMTRRAEQKKKGSNETDPTTSRLSPPSNATNPTSEKPPISISRSPKRRNSDERDSETAVRRRRRVSFPDECMPDASSISNDLESRMYDQQTTISRVASSRTSVNIYSRDDFTSIENRPPSEIPAASTSLLQPSTSPDIAEESKDGIVSWSEDLPTNDMDVSPKEPFSRVKQIQARELRPSFVKELASTGQTSQQSRESKHASAYTRAAVLKKVPPSALKKSVAETSNITTPGNSLSRSTIVKGTHTTRPPIADGAGKSAATSASHRTRGAQANAVAGSSTTRNVRASRNVSGSKSRKKEKDPPMPPAEYAKMVQDRFRATGEGVGRGLRSDYLRGVRIFYVSSDLRNATEETRERMKFILRHGGTLIPTWDATLVTHIVTESHSSRVCREIGVKSLKDIPDHIPTVKWSWVTSGMGKKVRKDVDYSEQRGEEGWRSIMAEVHKHATFASRIEAGSTFGVLAKQREKDADTVVSRGPERSRGKAGKANSRDFSRISEFTRDENSSDDGDSEERHTRLSSVRRNETENAKVVTEPVASDDPLAEFYPQARADIDARWPDDEQYSSGQEDETEDVPDPVKEPRVKRGFTCDRKGGQPQNCVNQDIIDKLQRLKELHQGKPTDEDRWRVYSYGRSIGAIRSYPKRIESYDQARMIRGVGDKTALKIMEILQTGELRRIAYENTEDIKSTSIFQGIYGVGRHIAFQWYASGCRTLDDVKARKGGIKVSPVQEIGIRFYDDINDRMPRSEAQEIFDMIKAIALKFDPELFIEIMGSFRRGKADCGDIDIMITRPTDDGKTHAGILRRLLGELHRRNILTEDLSIPEDPDDLEAVYRGLCRKDASSRRRRIDFLTVPWKSRGAALLYYTGDDIFNRAIRLKANVLGYSLNQRGLSAGVVRDPRNRLQKLSSGNIVASESEEEIFRILGVPWQEPHERVRG